MQIRRYISLKYVLIENKLEIAVGKVCLCFGSLVPYVKAENDVKLCLSTWVTLCPNMAERCRHTKFHLYFILFVYALLVHSLVGQVLGIPNIDCVICL